MIRTKTSALKTATTRRRTVLRGATRLLRAKGKRITGQRTLLLEIILESEGHLDAAELYRRAKRRDPKINLATVYRTRNLFKESGLLQPTLLAQAHGREQFESSPEVEHYHFACVRCGKVIEFESPLIGKLKREAKRQFGVEVVRGSVVLEGQCPECRGKAG